MEEPFGELLLRNVNNTLRKARRCRGKKKVYFAVKVSDVSAMSCLYRPPRLPQTLKVKYGITLPALAWKKSLTGADQCGLEGRANRDLPSHCPSTSLASPPALSSVFEGNSSFGSTKHHVQSFHLL